MRETRPASMASRQSRSAPRISISTRKAELRAKGPPSGGRERPRPRGGGLGQRHRGAALPRQERRHQGVRQHPAPAAGGVRRVGDADAEAGDEGSILTNQMKAELRAELEAMGYGDEDLEPAP